MPCSWTAKALLSREVGRRFYFKDRTKGRTEKLEKLDFVAAKDKRHPKAHGLVHQEDLSKHNGRTWLLAGP